MATTILCSGYTAYGEMKLPGSSLWKKRSTTSFGVSFSKNLLQTQGAMGYGTSVNGISRTGGAYVQDVPTIKCTLSMEIDRTLLRGIFQAIGSSRNGTWGVKIGDYSTSIQWQLAECYLQSFNFNVSQGTNLTGSMDFLVAEDSVEYSWMKKKIVRRIAGSDVPIENGTDEDEGLLPYYGWKLMLNSTELDGITDFSFGFQQPVTPRYECSGSRSARAQFPSKATFGVPSYSFSYSRIPVKAGSIDFTPDSAGTFMKNSSELQDSKIKIYAWGDLMATLTGAVLESVAPTFEGFQPAEYSYRIAGVLT